MMMGKKIEGSGLLGGRPILRRKSILDAKFFLERDMFWGKT